MVANQQWPTFLKRLWWKHCELWIYQRYFWKVSSRSQIIKIASLKNFSKFTGKYKCRSFILTKLQVYSLQLYLKRYSSSVQTVLQLQFFKFFPFWMHVSTNCMLPPGEVLKFNKMAVIYIPLTNNFMAKTIGKP